jgi:hypothetical protein
MGIDGYRLANKLIEEIESGKINIDDICVSNKATLLSDIDKAMDNETRASLEYADLYKRIGKTVKESIIESELEIIANDIRTDEVSHKKELMKMRKIIEKLKEC